MDRLFSDIIQRKNLDTVTKLREFLIDKVCTVISTAGGHTYGRKGDSFKVEYVGEAGSKSMNRAINGGNNINYNQFTISDAMLEEDFVKQLEKKQKELEVTNEEINNLNEKLKYLRDTDSDIFVEDEYKVYKLVSMIENKDMSTEKRILELTKLINKDI